MTKESILEEAQRLTHGDRNKDYGHPLDDYTRTAALASALLAHKLKEPIQAHEMALLMICVKLSRQVNSPKRDNMVDAAGYAWVSQECIDEALRRTVANQAQIGTPGQNMAGPYPVGTVSNQQMGEQSRNRHIQGSQCDCENCHAARAASARSYAASTGAALGLNSGMNAYKPLGGK